MNQEENGITKLGCVNHDCDMCKQAQKQEPVATVQCINGLIIGYLDVMQPVGTKLYTSPPQRQPLTGEQIDDIANEYSDEFGMIAPDSWEDFARAVLKAANGIKE